MFEALKSYFEALHQYEMLVESFESDAQAGIYRPNLCDQMSNALEHVLQKKSGLIESVLSKKLDNRIMLVDHYHQFVKPVFDRHMAAYAVLNHTRYGE